MKKIFLFIVLLFCLHSKAQNNIYRYRDTANHITFYYTVKGDSSFLHGPYFKFNEENKLILRGFFKMNEKDSLWEELHPIAGTVINSGFYKNDKKTGEWKMMDLFGNPTFQYNYDTHQLSVPHDSIYTPHYLNSHNLTSDSSATFLFDQSLDRVAIYYGGFKLLFNELSAIVRYPIAERGQRHQGISMLEFFIGSDGSVEKYIVKKSSGYAGLDDEALRAASYFTAGWLPAIQGGRPVRSSIILPVVFKLQ